MSNGRATVTMSQRPSSPPPGWYPDPSGAKGEKYWDGQQWTQGPPPVPRKQASLKKVLIVCGALLAVIFVISLFQGGDDKADETASSDTTTEAVSPSDAVIPVPLYRLEIGAKPSTLEVYVDSTPTLEEADMIVVDLQGKYEGQEDGYFVTINCSQGGTRDMDNRLANGKFAIGNIGAARTGLPDGTRDVSLVEGAQCPLPALPSAAAPSAVTAQQVVDAVIAAGLPATDPRDNSPRICQDAGCVQLITTDDFSAYQFPDVESATKWASAFPAGYQNGTVFLRYTEGGSNPTDPAMIPQYNAVLDNLMAGR